MGFYDKYILPCCLDKACSIGPITKQRAKVVPQAIGTVLEIGIGSGLNLPHYSAKNRAKCQIEVERIGLSGEDIPLENKTADTVVVTYSLCTIPDPVKALHEMARILKPRGKILFTEHGKAPDAGVAKWQNLIDPFWKKIAGGCHSGRDIPALFKQAGLTLESLDEMYIPGPRVLGYNYWGSAVH